MKQFFYDMLQKLVAEIDRDAVESEVRQLESGHPGLTRKEVAALLTRRAALKASTTGAAAGAAGGIIALIATAPDVLNLVRQQSRLILGIAILYGREPKPEERAREVLATLAISSGAYALRRGMTEVIRRGLEREIAERVGRRLVGRLVARRIPALAPIAGTFIGGSLNYLAVRAAGRAAVAYYGD